LTLACQRSALKNALLVCALTAFAVLPSQAASLRYCDAHNEVDAAVQDRLIQVAGIVKNELERSGQSVALVARSGLALSRFDQRYSHEGVSLKASDNAPWSVRQLYYACDEQRPRIFDQGMSGFVLGVNDPAEGYVSIVFLPDDDAAALERAALDDRRALQLLGTTYSANAYAFSQRYQNCNQWLIELLASVWNPPAPGDDARAQAQQWLQSQGYSPSVIKLGWTPLVWLTHLVYWLHNDDHPSVDLAAAQFRVSMPASIESFVHSRLPQAMRIELCYTPQQVVLRRGWQAIAQGCIAEDTDEIIELVHPDTVVATATSHRPDLR
jgi:hypothetical protein